jgi:hypothetical protein
MRITLLILIVFMPIIVFAVDNRCPKGYDWNDRHKRCVTAPPEENDGACTKSAKPWVFKCSTSEKLLSIDTIYRSGYYIERHLNGFFFLKKRGSSAGQEVSGTNKGTARPTADSADLEK